MRQWNFYNPEQLKASGWLRRQLEIQANGLSGNLDKVWRDVRDSAWIGGDAESWERVPYWLDGFIPLAYLLDDSDLKVRAKKYIDAIISFQKPNGWICPCMDEDIPTYDTWAVLLISKVLKVYYDCSHDERIPDVLYRAMKNYYELLSTGDIKLFTWGKYRWYEGFTALDFLWERYHEEWIGKLGKLLKEQGTDYDSVSKLWKRPLNKWILDTHIVNLAMMLKSEVVSCDLCGETFTGNADKWYRILSDYNGTAVGTFTGDECLSGLSPIQGTELCAVAEIMYSYELLYAYTGDSKWAELLEKFAFNALPATISDDMWTHQYDQMSNQISCEKFPGRPIFRTNSAESHLFGLEVHYGCCTANFSQAWPKLALSAFLYNGDTVLSALPIPSKLQTEDISIELSTEYPFNNMLTYTIKPGKAFCFKIRIPSFAQNLTVNGEQICRTPELTFDIEANRSYTISIGFETVANIEDRPNGLKTVVCGPLVFSIPIKYKKIMLEYEKNGVERKFPYCDYEYKCDGDWQYGLCSEKLEKKFNGLSDIPFSSENPPVTISAKVKPIEWGFEDGFETVCAKVPGSVIPNGEEKTIILWPYGCAKLRITEMPLCEPTRDLTEA